MAVMIYTSTVQRFFNFIRMEIVRGILLRITLLALIFISIDGVVFMYSQPTNTDSNALASLLLSLLALLLLPLALTNTVVNDFSSHYDATLHTLFRYPATYVSARLVVNCILSFILSTCILGIDFLYFFCAFPLSSSVRNYLYPLSGKIFIAAILIAVCYSVGFLAMVLLFKNRFVGLIAYGLFFVFFPWLVGLFLPQNIAIRIIPLLAAINIFSPQNLLSWHNALYWQGIGSIVGWTLVLIVICLILISILPNRQPPRFIQNIVNKGSRASRFLR